MREAGIKSTVTFRHKNQEISLPTLDFGTSFQVCFVKGGAPGLKFLKEKYRCFFVHLGFGLRLQYLLFIEFDKVPQFYSLFFSYRNRSIHPVVLQHKMLDVAQTCTLSVSEYQRICTKLMEQNGPAENTVMTEIQELDDSDTDIEFYRKVPSCKIY